MEKRNHVKYLEKWYKIMFWMIVPTMIGNIMLNDTVVELIPAIQTPARLVTILAGVLTAVVTLKMKEFSPKLAFAGWGLIGLAIWGLLEGFWLSYLEIGIITSLVAAIVSLVVQYHRYYGHSEVLSSYDFELSEKWKKLWKWEIISLGTTLGSLLITVLIPVIGILIVLAGSIALLVVSVLNWVYLYQTWKFFEEYEIREKYKDEPPLVGDLPPMVEAVSESEPEETFQTEM